MLSSKTLDPFALRLTIEDCLGSYCRIRLTTVENGKIVSEVRDVGVGYSAEFTYKPTTDKDN